MSQEGYKAFSSLDYMPEADMFEIIKMVEEMMFDVLKPDGFDMDALINDFFSMALYCGVNLKTLYTLYIGKNILNRFRQDNGYKEGSYVKVWNGDEDNVVMLDIMAKNPEYGVDELYKSLDEVYQKL